MLRVHVKHTNINKIRDIYAGPGRLIFPSGKAGKKNVLYKKLYIFS